MYNGTREAIVGKCRLHATQNGVKHTVELNVLHGKYTPILKLESCVALGFLKIFDCDQPERVYSSMKSSTVLTKQQVLEQFQDVFTGLGKQNPSQSQCTASCTPPKKDTGSHPQRIEGKAW